MFEFLSDKIGNVFSKLGAKGKLSEKDIDAALREVRLALLEADVGLKVVKEFTTRVRERCLTSEVLESLTPAQQVVKIVHEELVTLLGTKETYLTPASHPPTIVMLVGLQGSGKTTTAAKLGLHFRRNGQVPLLVAADTRRPAAIQQLITLGKQLDLSVYSEDPKVPVPKICSNSLKKARELSAHWVIVDTQGRLHIDEELMKEVAETRKAIQPTEVLLVVDSMAGQEAVRVAEEFHSKVGLTGVILTKLDGDARGGAALTVRSVAGVPIKFLGVGEKPDALEPFYPDRLASRILGMGDMLTLIEKAERTFDEEKTRELEKKMRSATFDLEDFLEQLQQVKKMGSITQLMDMIPGMSKLARQQPGEVDDSKLKKIEAIIRSMTSEERRNPSIIDGSRRRRIARGSGTTPQDINQLLNQFRQTQKLLKQIDSKKGFNPMSLLK
jgi:signal recognition particle subunit SRP54